MGLLSGLLFIENSSEVIRSCFCVSSLLYPETCDGASALAGWHVWRGAILAGAGSSQGWMKLPVGMSCGIQNFYPADFDLAAIPEAFRALNVLSCAPDLLGGSFIAP